MIKPFRIVMTKDFYDSADVKIFTKTEDITYEVFWKLTDIYLIECAGECKCWNKDIGNYYYVKYTFSKDGTKKHPDQNKFYYVGFYFKTKEESSEFITALINRFKKKL